MLVHVVRLRQHRQPPGTFEVIHVAAGPVALRARAGHHPPKRAVAKRHLGHDVDGLGCVAVVEARKAALFAALVEYFHLVHHVGGQVFEHRVRVIAEEFLTVDEHALHVFALGLHFAIGSAAHAGQLLDEVLGIGIRVGFEGFGVELRGVALLYRLRGLARHHHAFELNTAGLQGQRAQLQRLPGHCHGLAQLLVAHKRGIEHVAPGRHVIKLKLAVGIHGRAGSHRVRQANQQHVGPDKRRLVFTIGHAPAHRGGGLGPGSAQARQQ